MVQESELALLACEYKSYDGDLILIGVIVVDLDILALFLQKLWEHLR